MSAVTTQFPPHRIKYLSIPGPIGSYHKDECAQTFCQGLAKQQVADLEGRGQFLQVELLSAHVCLVSGPLGSEEQVSVSRCEAAELEGPDWSL